MPRKIDLTGQKFGKLSVLSEYDKLNGKIRWLCVCECGNKVTPTTFNLRNGNTKTCGCCNKALLLKGLKFGRLVVIKRCGINKHRAAIWECLCDCGKTTKATSHDLVTGHKTSCGCKHAWTLWLQQDAQRSKTSRILVSGKKRCPDCNKWKKLSLYSVSRDRAVGLKTYCKECQKKRDRRERELLPDCYIKQRLVFKTILRYKDITPEMITQKREQLLLHRELKKGREIINGTTGNRT